MATKKIQLPHKASLWLLLRKPPSKGFQKLWHAPFFSHQKHLVAIWHTPTIKWWSKFSNHHPTHPHHQMVTKTFQSPFNGGGVLDGDPKNLVTIRQIATIKWRSNFFDR
jgi:hypothetical protein